MNITRSPRHVGIGMLNSEGSSLSGIAMEIAASGRKVGKVSGTIAADQMFSAEAAPGRATPPTARRASSGPTGSG
ncbi:hypothetical protein [Nonomuraea sp. NPDC049725]|uniref:hypothetical protein n=1 Tax=Nonomuraea sp. NPDC049725 TaxID=3154508 RepID=UPI00342B3445